MAYFAHSGKNLDKSDWQSLQGHARAVARSAEALASRCGLKRASYVAGLFHDLGKHNPDFQRRLEGAAFHLDHSTAGAATVPSLATDTDAGAAELVAYAVPGHHAGLPDPRQRRPGSKASSTWGGQRGAACRASAAASIQLSTARQSIIRIGVPCTASGPLNSSNRIG